MPLILLIQLLIIYAILYLSSSQNQFYQIQPHDISALIGSNITIPCVVALPHGDVQWTKDGLALGYDRQLPAFPTWSIIGDEDRGEFNFLIQSLKLDDEGVFACEVSPYKDAPALKQVAHVRALVQPTHVQINDQLLSNKTTIVNVRFDETIHQINCQVDGARPAAHIKWFNETGQEFPATSRTYTQNRLFTTISTLTLVPSLFLHEKRFTCHVHHETLLGKIDKLYTSVEIQITSPPNIPIIHGYTSSYRLINSSYLTLSCQCSGGNPLGRLSWYRLENDNKRLNLIDNSSNVILQQNLTMNNISMIITPSDNNVTFSCHVTNDYLYSLGQILQTNITLQVAFGPSSVRIRDNNMNTTTLTEGTPRQFQCRTSSSNPRAVVVWRLDGQILSADIDALEEPGELSGTIIQLTKTLGLDKILKEYHKKILSCEARNPDTGHMVIDSTELNIIYDATSIEMQGITPNKLVKSGDTITAQCILSGGQPLGKIVWYKGGELLQSKYTTETGGNYATSHVEFIVVSSDNNLPLTCKGQVDSFPQKFASFILNVTFLPMELMIIGNEFFSNLSMDINSRREFECRASTSNPQTQLKIIRQTNDGKKHLDLQYKTSSSQTNGINSIKFMLPPIDLSLHGNLLTCEALLDIDTIPLTKQVTYVLNVNHKPYFHDFYTSIEVKENQSFNITLETKAYPMPINYKWFHPAGRQIMNDQLNIFVNQDQISLINVQRSDSGIYHCIASNSIGNTEVNFTLNVLFGPVIIRTQGYSLTEALMPGASAILLCVVDGNPINLSNVKWFKDNQEISSDQWEKRMERNEVSLIRKSIHREDAGQYACEIDNQLGHSSATLPLIIQYAPEIDRANPSRNKAAADSDRLLTVELHCYLSAIPKPTVVWMKENQILPSSSSKYQSILNDRINSSSFSPNLTFEAILYITNITKSDYGIYQCKAENKLGIDISEIILTGLTVPDPPNDIQITNISHSSLLISWIPGFDGGSPQTFQIRYRLSTDNRYSYVFIPSDLQSFDLKNLRLGSEYHISIRSNNSYHLSEWTQDLIKSTLSYLPSPLFHSSESPRTKYSFTFLFIIALIGLSVIIINLILVSFFFLKRQRSNVSTDNSSTTGTNETEANTVDIFQPIPSNFFLTTTTTTSTSNTYQKYEDDDIQRPFVSSYSVANLSNQDNSSSTYAVIKKDRYSPYDNFQVHRYYPTSIDNNHVTYRSFKDGSNSSSDIHECIRAELV